MPVRANGSIKFLRVLRPPRKVRLHTSSIRMSDLRLGSAAAHRVIRLGSPSAQIVLQMSSRLCEPRSASILHAFRNRCSLFHLFWQSTDYWYWPQMALPPPPPGTDTIWYPFLDAQSDAAVSNFRFPEFAKSYAISLFPNLRSASIKISSEIDEPLLIRTM